MKKQNELNLEFFMPQDQKPKQLRPKKKQKFLKWHKITNAKKIRNEGQKKSKTSGTRNDLTCDKA